MTLRRDFLAFTAGIFAIDDLWQPLMKKAAKAQATTLDGVRARARALWGSGYLDELAAEGHDPDEGSYPMLRALAQDLGVPT